VNSGMVVCAVPQTIFGRLNMNVYENGRELQKTGILNLDGMTSEAAFVKLGWCLGHRSWDLEKVKEMMLDFI
jgi:glutamyl-tRNA(Gln) amidotransferase subunit D